MAHSAAVIVQSFRRQNTVAAGYSAINKHDIVLMGSLLVSVSTGDWVSFSPVRGADSLLRSGAAPSSKRRSRPDSLMVVLGDHTTSDRVKHEFSRVMDVELLQNVCAMRLDRGGADREQIRNGFIAASFRDQLENFSFTYGQ